MHLKRFLDWISLKERLHLSENPAPRVSEGQVWWASLGENIGVEINGKSKLFSRPVLIFKKLSHQLYFVIPLSTQKRMGTWYVNYRQEGKEITACLQQARAIDYRRLSSRLGWVDDSDYERIKIAFRNLYL